MPLIECVPNFSEGRDASVIAAIADAITAAHGRVLDWSLDAWHHRAVITFVAEEQDVVGAAFAAIQAAQARIDLRTHSGVHPRIGAADVVPFIPLDGVTMAQCVARAQELAERVGRDLHIPVYLYERAAMRAEYRNLADVRAGGTAALAAHIATTRTPDAGPHALHPSAGAVAIGAREFLGAFNVFVGDVTQLPAARAIARALRAANGGLPGVKALGLVVDGQAQVSMNVTDLNAVSLESVFDAVAREAIQHGTRATHSEVIGLLPQRVIESGFRDRIQLRDTRDSVSLEHRIAQVQRVDDLSSTAHAIASLDLPEASGTAAALAAVLAAATVRLAAGVHVARANGPAAEQMRPIVASAQQIERALHTAARDDAQAWQAVIRARRLPAGTPDALAARIAAIDVALVQASDVPLRIAALARDLVALAAEAAVEGDHVTAPDAWTAATLAHGAVLAALGLARGNLAMLADSARAAAPRDAARAIRRDATALLDQARIAVKHVADE